jgi:hypothetical protein
MGVGIALAGEGLEVTGAVLVNVIDDPCLFRLPVRAFPSSLADRHNNLLYFSKYRECSPTSANAQARHRRDK